LAISCGRAATGARSRTAQMGMRICMSAKVLRGGKGYRLRFTSGDFKVEAILEVQQYLKQSVN
jgi:hypothetical protein